MVKLSKHKTVAFLDIGTNSIRILVIEDYGNESYRILTQQKETVRLGEGEFTDGNLKAEAMHRAVVVCQKFHQLAKTFGSDEIIAIATAATREAYNQEEFLDKLLREADLNINVISGREEARLIYLGIVSGFNLGFKNSFFIDIGGGSTELIVGNGTHYHYLDSVKLGAIRLTTIFLKNKTGSISSESYQLIQNYVKHHAIRSIQKIKEFPRELAFGSSGTIENLANITYRTLYKRKIQKEDFLEYSDLKKTIDLLCSLSLAERRQVPGINPERADIIICGAAIIDTLMQELKISRLQVSERSLRDGLLIDYLNRTSNEQFSERISFREKRIIQLGRACGFDENHAQQVKKICGELFETAKASGLHHFNDFDKELLKYAALLHDIGAFLTYSDHHIHSHYLICNADLLGFNQTEIDMMACLALYHRKAYPRKKHLPYASLNRASQQAVFFLSTLLRIGETLDRSHQGIIEKAQLSLVAADKILLKLTASADCQLEIWGLKNQQASLATAFGKNFEFQLTQNT